MIDEEDSPQEIAYKVKLQAHKEVNEEDFKVRVEAEKIKIREHKSLWGRICPFKIVWK